MAMSAACGQVRKRSRNAKVPTATWTSLRLASLPVRPDMAERAQA